MITSLSFFVDGTPRPQPRHRPTRAGGAVPAKHIGAWKAAVASAFKAAIEEEALCVIQRRTSFATAGEPLVLDLQFCVKGAATSRPDLDNLAKAVMDALQKAGAFVDDSQIVRLTCEKVQKGRSGMSAQLVEGVAVTLTVLAGWP